MGISRSEIIDLISQLNEYVNEIAGGFTLFLHQNASADIGGYLLLTTADPDDVKTDVGPFAITGVDQELEQFATAAGEPGLTTLQHGVYEMHFHAEKTAGTKNAEVYFKVYKRAAGGAETLLGTSEVTSAIGSGESEYSIHTSIVEQILLVDDRIVLKLFGSPVGLGSDPTISVYVEGVTLSRLTIPVSIGDIGAPNVDTNIYSTNDLGGKGFIHGSDFGALWYVSFADLNADIDASFYVKYGGSFKVLIIHASGDNDNTGKTAGGVLSVGEAASDEGAFTWDLLNAVNADMVLGETDERKFYTHATAVSISSERTVAVKWAKDNNAGGAAGNMYIFQIILVRQ